MLKTTFFRYPLRALTLGWCLIISNIGGAYACDSYDAPSQRLTIPSVVVNGTTYTNVVASVTGPDLRWVDSAEANSSVFALPDMYDIASQRLTIPCVTIGAVTYTNVVVALPIEKVISVGGWFTTSNIPILTPRYPLPDAWVGEAYSQPVDFKLIPPSDYTFMIDTLAAGNGTPTSMTLNMNGILSGTPFATGAADVNAYQVPHAYTFGVCARDTLTHNTTTPCPLTKVTVNPIRLTVAMAGSGSGTVTASPTGNSCGVNCYSGFASGSTVRLAATAASGSRFAGWSSCIGTDACPVQLTASRQVTATFEATSLKLAGTWNWSGTGSFGCNYSDGGAIAMTLTPSGNGFSGTIDSAAGVQNRWSTDCSLARTDTAQGTIAGTLSGGTVTFTTLTIGAMSFSGSGTFDGSTLTATIQRNGYGGSGRMSSTTSTSTCSNGATNYPTCTLPTCANGATDYPTCTAPTCANGSNDYPYCTNTCYTAYNTCVAPSSCAIQCVNACLATWNACLNNAH